MNSLDELILKWQEGSLTADEMPQLNALLEHRENRQILLEQFLLNAGLPQACAQPSFAPPGNIVAMPQAVPNEPKTPAWRWVTAAAACVAFCSLIVRLMIGGADGPLLAKTGQQLSPGDFVQAPDNEEREIRFDNGKTSIRLKSGSSLELLAIAPRKEFRLHSGSMTAAVAPQREPMLIRTPQAEAFVIGTEFVLSTLPHSTRLDVSSGKVRLRRTADGQDLEVRGNESATVAPQAEFARLPQPPAPWRNEDIGQVEMHGSAFVEGSRCLIRGAGRNTCLKKDQLHFMYQKVAGDFEFKARLVSFTARSASARAGVMVRRSLETACRQAFIAYRGDLQVEVQCRPETESREVLLTPADLPVWIKVARAGSTVSFAISRDNESWQTLGSEKVEFGETAFTGLAVTSFDNEVLDESVFDQVTVASSLGAKSVKIADYSGTQPQSN